MPYPLEVEVGGATVFVAPGGALRAPVRASEPPAAQGPALVRPQRLAAANGCRSCRSCSGGPPVHARRGDRRRARRGRGPPGPGHRDAVHEARRGHHRRGGRPGGRRPLPGAARADQGRGDRRRDQRQADAARPRHRRGRLLRAPAQLAAAAEAQGSYLWIDMEDSAYVDRTLDLYQRLRAVARPNTGICLQAYLRRTAKDVERLLPLGPGDPAGEGRLRRAAAVAFRSKKEVDANYLGLAVTLAPREPDPPRSASASARTTWTSSSRSRRTRPPRACPRTPSRSRCCTGSGPRSSAGSRRSGYKVQVLIAYGAAWYPLVHAPARRAPRQRAVRPPPGAARLTSATRGYLRRKRTR